MRPQLSLVAALAVVTLTACAPVGTTRGGDTGSARGGGATASSRPDPVAGRITLGEEGEVDCAEMLEFVGTDAPLPGEPQCRISAFQDTFYEAATTASPEDVEAWLAALEPPALLGPPADQPWACPEGVDRCVDVTHEPGTSGRWHFMEVEVTGSGADAAVRIAAYTT